eukprot:gb/GECG01002031.1/.p1 GENE.gb/GECG01002031.1/~~gb/GECG01002031.1/.p1  ORF type:complete len:1147 (+),score=172.86 gb/GECG01002031.1/:1-3441(+)
MSSDTPPKILSNQKFRRPQSARQRSYERGEGELSPRPNTSPRSQWTRSSTGSGRGDQRPFSASQTPPRDRRSGSPPASSSNRGENDTDSREQIIQRALRETSSLYTESVSMSPARSSPRSATTKSPNTPHRQLRFKKRPHTAEPVAKSPAAIESSVKETFRKGETEGSPLSRNMDKHRPTTGKIQQGVLTEPGTQEVEFEGLSSPLQNSLQQRINQRGSTQKTIASPPRRGDKVSMKELFAQRASVAFSGSHAAVERSLMNEDFKERVEQEEKDSWFVERLHVVSPARRSLEEAPLEDTSERTEDSLGVKSATPRAESKQHEGPHPSAGDEDAQKVPSVATYASDSYEARLTSKLVELLRGSVDNYLQRQRFEIDNLEQQKFQIEDDVQVAPDDFHQKLLEKDLKIATLETSVRLLRARVEAAERRRAEAVDNHQRANSEREAAKAMERKISDEKKQLSQQAKQARQKVAILEEQLQHAQHRTYELLGENDSLRENIGELTSTLEWEKSERKSLEEQINAMLHPADNQSDSATFPKLVRLRGQSKQLRAHLRSLRKSFRMATLNLSYDVQEVSSWAAQQLLTIRKLKADNLAGGDRAAMKLEDVRSAKFEVKSRLQQEKKDHQKQLSHLRDLLHHMQHRYEKALQSKTSEEESVATSVSIPKRPPATEETELPSVSNTKVSRSCQTPTKTTALQIVSAQCCRTVGPNLSHPDVREKRINPDNHVEISGGEHRSQERTTVVLDAPMHETICPSQTRPQQRVAQLQQRVAQPQQPVAQAQQPVAQGTQNVYNIAPLSPSPLQRVHLGSVQVRSAPLQNAELTRAAPWHEFVANMTPMLTQCSNVVLCRIEEKLHPHTMDSSTQIPKEKNTENATLKNRVAQLQQSQQNLHEDVSESVASNLSLQRALNEESEHNSRLRSKVHYLRQDLTNLEIKFNEVKKALSREEQRNKALTDSMDAYKNKVVEDSEARILNVLRFTTGVETKLKFCRDIIKAFSNSKIANEVGIQLRLQQTDVEYVSEGASSPYDTVSGYSGPTEHDQSRTSPKKQSIQHLNKQSKQEALEDSFSGKLSVKQMQSFVRSVVSSQTRKEKLSVHSFAEQTSQTLEQLWQNIIGSISKCREAVSKSSTEVQRLHLGVAPFEVFAKRYL